VRYTVGFLSVLSCQSLLSFAPVQIGVKFSKPEISAE